MRLLQGSRHLLQIKNGGFNDEQFVALGFHNCLPGAVYPGHRGQLCTRYGLRPVMVLLEWLLQFVPAPQPAKNRTIPDAEIEKLLNETIPNRYY
jgi:hypothetical protein